MTFDGLRFKRIVVDHVFRRRTLHNHACCATVRASEELPSIKDEIILLHYESLDSHLGYFVLMP